MTARYNPAAPTFLPNNNLSLRTVSAWIDKGGRDVSVDAATIGWLMSSTEPPMPVVFGGLPPQAEITVIYDREMKVWTDRHGNRFDQWRDVVAPLFRAWDLKQAREQLEGAKKAEAAKAEADRLAFPIKAKEAGVAAKEAEAAEAAAASAANAAAVVEEYQKLRSFTGPRAVPPAHPRETF